MTTPSSRPNNTLLENGAAVAVAAYDEGTPLPQGFRPIDIKDIAQKQGQDSGFQARVYVNPDARQVWIGVAGTNDLKDAGAWATAEVGYSPFWNTGHIDDAVKFAASVRDVLAKSKDYSGHDIIVTGHSLGGLCAELLGETFGWKSVGLDSPGAKAILSDDRYTARLNELGLSIKGSPGHVAANADATLVGLFGNHIDNTQHYIVETNAGTAVRPGLVSPISYTPGSSAALGLSTLGVVVHAKEDLAQKVHEGRYMEVPGQSTSPVENTFELTTMTTSDIAREQTIAGERTVNADGATLVKKGSYHLGGKGDVNKDIGLTAYANNILSDGFRPGNHNPAREILDDPLARTILGSMDTTTASSLNWNPSDSLLQYPSAGQKPLLTWDGASVVPNVPFATQQNRSWESQDTKAAAMSILSSGVRNAVPTDPLVLDLDGNGVTLSDINVAPVLFDVDGDGKKELTGWVAGNDGLLVMDVNGDGEINSARELLSEHFSPHSGKRTEWEHGFKALASLDSNRDGTFTAADDAWTGRVPEVALQSSSKKPSPLFDPEVRERLGILGEQCADLLDAYEQKFFTAFSDFFDKARTIVEGEKTVSVGRKFSFAPQEAGQKISALGDTLKRVSKELTADYKAAIGQRLAGRPWYEKDDVISYVERADRDLFFRLLRLDWELWEKDLDELNPVKYTVLSQEVTEAPGSTSVRHQVRVWQDKNHDGKADPDELSSLDDLGISSISLRSVTESGLRSAGNAVRERGTFVRNGETHQVLAIDFTSEAGGGEVIVNPDGSVTFTDESGQTSYVATNPAGEVVDVAIKGVTHAQGTEGDDTLIGDETSNWLIGQSGRDIFRAGDGDDVLVIDADDRLSDIDAGAGSDMIIATGDKGVLLNLETAHTEIFRGGDGNDVVFAGGNTTVYMRGGAGNDTLIGGGANDALSGEDGNDHLAGKGGNDILRGHRGRDLLEGGAGNDTLEGGQDDDVLQGGADNDVLIGGSGDDILDGGSGDDVAEFSGSYADYKITRISKDAWRIVDRTGRDGADTLLNVEHLSFSDIGWVNPEDIAPMPVGDILDLDADGSALTRTAPHRIEARTLLENDSIIGEQTVRIYNVSDASGGTVVLDESGDVFFTPDPSYKGLMGFSYSLIDGQGSVAKVSKIVSGEHAILKGSVVLRTPDIPADPLLAKQWYLEGANIFAAWDSSAGRGYTGDGVRIGIFEPGSDYSVSREIIDPTHPDLRPNLAPMWLADPTPGRGAGEGSDSLWSKHATMVAGVMVGARNDEGGVGVAYDATLGSHWIAGDLSDISAMGRYMDYDVVNNSWGASKPYAIRFGETVASGDYINAVRYGRGGLGTVMVLAGGNERQSGGNANTDNFGNNRYGIQVGGINAAADLGLLKVAAAPFSNPGASLLISAPASSVLSSSRLVETSNGSIFGADYDLAQGTSFATPVISGVVALMLEANPNLGYRDVQEILALSARKVDDPNTDWQTNGAKNWNGGGMHTSHDYGYGAVDARAAVRLAETWTGRHSLANEQSREHTSGLVNKYIEDHQTESLRVSMADGLMVEHVEVDLKLTHERWGDLIVTLVSPSGTESILANRIGKAPGRGVSATGSDQSGELSFTFMSTNSWGETSEGEWTLRVTDAETGATGILERWSLRLFGKENSPDDTYVYTDEYTNNSGATRTYLNDRDGGKDTLNAAAVSGNSVINLRTGAASYLAGKTLIIQNPQTIENVFTGDGNDTIVGNTVANVLDGGRGTNTLTGDRGTDFFVIRQRPDGQDTITDFEPISGEKIALIGFGEITFADLEITSRGRDTVIAWENGQSLCLVNVLPSQLTAEHFEFQETLSLPQVYTDSQAVVLHTTSRDISGTEGNEILRGTHIDEHLQGKGGDDHLYGNAGHDILDGGDGSDILDGGAGDDVIYLDGDVANMTIDRRGTSFTKAYATGGTGSDRFVVRAPAERGQNSNIVTDFDINDPEEKIDLSQVGVYNFSELRFSQWSINNMKMVPISLQLGGSNLVSLLGLTKEQMTPHMFIFAQPSGATERVEEPLPGSIIETVNGQTFVHGNAGGTTLDGGPGPQTMDGRTGHDSYVINHAGDVIVEQSDGGYDVARSDISFTLPEHVEKLILMGAEAINGTGNDLANRLEGNDAANHLDGRGGSDQMVGKGGNDTYVVESNGDTILEKAGGGIDTVESFVSFVLPDHVENLVLVGDGLANATGNDLDNVLTGNASANTLDGGRGNDLLIGGKGGDLYLFGVGYGVDTIRENDNTPDTVDTLRFTAGIDHGRLWFDRSGNNLEMTILGTENKVVVEDWYLGAAHHVEHILSGDGKVLSSARVDALVEAMDAYNAAPADQLTLPAIWQQHFSAQLETAWI